MTDTLACWLRQCLQADLFRFFFPSIKYFVRILLAALLLVAMAIGFSIVVALITIPFTMMAIMNGNLGASLITLESWRS